MVQTQLASMYIGNPAAYNVEEKLTGVSNDLTAMIHVLDGQSNTGIIYDFITPKNIIDDTHKKSLEKSLETYNFIAFGNRRYC